MPPVLAKWGRMSISLHPDTPEGRTLAAPPVAESGPAARGSGTKIRSRLFTKYVALFVAVVGVALLSNGIFEVFFYYREHKAALIRIQHEQAEAAAAKISQFIKEIESQLGWTTQLPWSAGSIEPRRFDALRLLRQVPAITELAQIDSTGKERLRVSRLAMDVVDSGVDLSKDPKFTEAVAHKVYYGPVYFRRESEPYMTLSLAGTRKDAGVSIAEVNLKLIWDVVSQIKVGEHGHAYVVGAQGTLDRASRYQPGAAQHRHVEAGAGAGSPIGDCEFRPRIAAGRAQYSGPGGADGIRADRAAGLDHVRRTPRRGSLRFAVSGAAAPRHRAVGSAGVCGVCRSISGAAHGRPDPGVARGRGAHRRRRFQPAHLDQDGDELEGLANQFNDMGARLQESYADLEKKVELRTTELSESLEHQTATSEVLQVISRSPGDLDPVFQTILVSATRICDAQFGLLLLCENGGFRCTSVHNLPQAFAETFSRTPVICPPPSDPLGRLALTHKLIHVADVTQEPDYVAGFPPIVELAELGGARTLLLVPMLKEDSLVGVIAIFRQTVRLFTDKQSDLVTSFASQAVIAIENGRLLNELRKRTTELSQSLDELRTAQDRLVQTEKLASLGQLTAGDCARNQESAQLRQQLLGAVGRIDRRVERRAQAGRAR